MFMLEVFECWVIAVARSGRGASRGVHRGVEHGSSGEDGEDGALGQNGGEVGEVRNLAVGGVGPPHESRIARPIGAPWFS